MSENFGALEKALADLEWERLSSAVLSRCTGPRAAGEPVPIASTREGAELALRETREALRVLDDGERLPLDGIPDVREAIARLARKGALDGPSLRDIGRALSVARSLRRFLGARREKLPALYRSVGTDPTLDGLEEEISAHIGADGLLFDHASEELRRLRTETANLRARLVRRLEEMIVQRSAILQDGFYTLREGRYVLPVRRDSHERIEGIVHGTSSSGATVFVEPEALIGQGNRLKMALAEQEREEARIFAVLSESVADRLAEVRAAIDALDHADLRQAAARFGVDLRAKVLPLSAGPELHLFDAKHPLLLLDGAKVVPNELHLESGKALILSGPNAGGKTVALKMMGLAALMMRAGLPIPAEDGSAVGFFEPVLSDMGDEQSIEKNLSTFSAHVTNLRGILEEAGPTSMVLLDELAGGTDPGEGAALACAVVERLAQQGAATAVTTHYEALKALATRDARFRNAAVGFDVANMRPTFELALDVPGASSALRVALRFGIPASVIERAEEVLPEHSRTFDALVRELEALKQKAVSELDVATRERAVADAAREEAREKLAKLQERDRARLGQEAERILQDLRQARDELRAARKKIRLAAGEAELEEARKALEAAAEATARAEREMPAPRAVSQVGEALTEEDVRVGERVYVERLRKEAEILEEPSRGKVRVAVGPMKLWVEVAELRRGAPREGTPVRLASSATPTTPRPASMPTADTTLDVRGLRVDDAIPMAEQFLDRAYGDSQHTVYILHGVGSGALRDAIREHLARDARYVKSVRPATADEGGPRMTVVELR
ncbi:MAG: Smr/MutS family protein [Polyangiaceae bacterium]|nr:Smr/MutS family protein [Polyangiaceae bacterium]